MSEENIEVVRAFFEAWNARDMDAVREMHDPNAITRAPEGWPEPGPFVGRNAVMGQFERLRAAWTTDTVEPISGFSSAGDRVVVRFLWRALGEGPPPNMEFTDALTVRAGRIHGHEYFWDHAEALEAAGLSE